MGPPEFFAKAFDVIEAILIGTVALLLSPWHMLVKRHPTPRFLKRMSLLLDQCLLSFYARAVLNEAIARTDLAIAAYESILGSIEMQMASQGWSGAHRALISHLYQRLARAYLSIGAFEDLSVTFMRAHKMIGLEKVAGIEHFDIRMAQIIKAALAAGKMLDQDGVATLLVRPPSRSTTSKVKSGVERGIQKPRETPLAKVIPLRSHKNP